MHDGVRCAKRRLQVYATRGSAPSYLPSQVWQGEVLRHQRVHPSALLGVCDFDAVMIDEVLRLFDPLGPAVGANACQNPLTPGAGEGCLVKTGSEALAAGTRDISHYR